MRPDSRNWVTLGGEKLLHVCWESLAVCKEPELEFSHPSAALTPSCSESNHPPIYF